MPNPRRLLIGSDWGYGRAIGTVIGTANRSQAQGMVGVIFKEDAKKFHVSLASRDHDSGLNSLPCGIDPLELPL